jgi:8-oxo-dGTP pyrophosphatase MutT (NUDIX family)
MQLPESSSHRRAVARDALARLAAAAPTEDGQPGSPVTLAHNDAEAIAYLAALTDFLQMLGVVEQILPAEQLRIPSFQAGYFLHLLIALLDIRAPLVADWTYQGVSTNSSHVFHAGSDLLHALEQRRLELVPLSSPLRQITAAIGLIARRLDGRQVFLVAWDAAAHSWQFIGGKVEIKDTSIRAAMMRELAEELACPPLVEDVDVTLIELGPVFEEQRISPTVGLLTRTSFQVYAVRFLRPLPALPADVRWVDQTELMAGVTNDAQPIAATLYWRIRDSADRVLDSFVTAEIDH